MLILSHARFLIKQIISFNNFRCLISNAGPRTKVPNQHNPLANQTTESEVQHSCGIWVHASYINHGCASNAHRAFIGYKMIVRASRDIEAGTEITFWCHSPGGASGKGPLGKKGRWDFVCGCAIYLDARATRAVIHGKRRKLAEDIKRFFSSSAPSKDKMERIVLLLDALDLTYAQPVQEVPRFLVYFAQLASLHLRKSMLRSHTKSYSAKMCRFDAGMRMILGSRERMTET